MLEFRQFLPLHWNSLMDANVSLSKVCKVSEGIMHDRLYHFPGFLSLFVVSKAHFCHRDKILVIFRVLPHPYVEILCSVLQVEVVIWLSVMVWLLRFSKFKWFLKPHIVVFGIGKCLLVSFLELRVGGLVMQYDVRAQFH